MGDVYCIERLYTECGKPYACYRKAKYTDEAHKDLGPVYCGIHAPQKKAERKQKRGPTQFERDCARRRKEEARLAALEDINQAARSVMALRNPETLSSLREAFRKLDELEANGG